MELTEQESQKLLELGEILELRDNRSWQRYRQRIEASVARIKDSLSNKRMLTWDGYMSLWYRKEALESILSDFDHIQAESDALKAKAATKPDNSPATGDLA